jgi:hypothetical protein
MHQYVFQQLFDPAGFPFMSRQEQLQPGFVNAQYFGTKI